MALGLMMGDVAMCAETSVDCVASTAYDSQP